MSCALLKKLTIACIVLVGLWGIYMVRMVPAQKAPFAKALDQAAQITVARSGQSVQFSKKENVWNVLLADGKAVAADQNRFSGLLNSIRSVVLEDVISDNSARAAEFEVDAASGTSLTVTDAKGKIVGSGVFGKMAQDMTHIFFRAPDAKDVYLARGLYRTEFGVIDPTAWRDRHLVMIPETEIKQITVESRGRKTDWVRVSTGAWTLNGKTMSADQVNDLVGKLAHLEADNYLTSMDEPVTFEQLIYARVIVQGEKSQAELRIGRLDKKAPRYPISSGKDNGIAWLSQATVESLLK